MERNDKNMEKIIFKDYPNTETLIDAENLNQLQDNVEEAITEVKNEIPTKVSELADANDYALKTDLENYAPKVLYGTGNPPPLLPGQIYIKIV